MPLATPSKHSVEFGAAGGIMLAALPANRPLPEDLFEPEQILPSQTSQQDR